MKLRGSLSERQIGAAVVLSGVVVNAQSAFAHHAMGGAMPRTLWEGFASGIAHPIIGPDHFAFVVLAALVFSLSGNALTLALTLIVSSLAGTVLRVLPLQVPYGEALVAVSLIVAGAIAIYRALVDETRETSYLAGVIAVAGVVHGFAWGESVVGTDSAVLGSYLTGLAIVQFAVLMGLSAAFRAVAGNMPRARARVLASAGAIGIIAGVGFLAVA